MEAGITFVLSPTTLLVTGLSVQLERGEESKLYRYVPTFTPTSPPKVVPGEPVDTVNANRLPVRARELLRVSAIRFSLGARVNHRMSSGTLRIEERAYVDNWGIKATTTDAKYYHDLGDRLRVWPHLRLHAQTGASFYKLAYSALIDQDNIPLQLLTYRTGDRELSPMIGVTAGGGSSHRAHQRHVERAVRHHPERRGHVQPLLQVALHQIEGPGCTAPSASRWSSDEDSPPSARAPRVRPRSLHPAPIP